MAGLGGEMEVQWAEPHSQQYFKQITPFSFIWILSEGTYTWLACESVTLI